MGAEVHQTGTVPECVGDRVSEKEKGSHQNPLIVSRSRRAASAKR
jgi:hypothetical protein